MVKDVVRADKKWLEGAGGRKERRERVGSGPRVPL